MTLNDARAKVLDILHRHARDLWVCLDCDYDIEEEVPELLDNLANLVLNPDWELPPLPKREPFPHLVETLTGLWEAARSAEDNAQD